MSLLLQRLSQQRSQLLAPRMPTGWQHTQRQEQQMASSRQRQQQQAGMAAVAVGQVQVVALSRRAASLTGCT